LIDLLKEQLVRNLLICIDQPYLIVKTILILFLLVLMQYNGIAMNKDFCIQKVNDILSDQITYIYFKKSY